MTDTSTQHWVTLSISKPDDKIPFCISAGILLGIIYILYPYKYWGSELWLLSSQICLGFGVVLYVFPRSGNSPLINGFLLIPLFFTAAILIPGKLIQLESQQLEWIIPETIFKLKYWLVNISPSLVIWALYWRKRKIRETASLFTISSQLRQPGSFGKFFSAIFLFFIIIYLTANIWVADTAIGYFSRVFYYAFQWYFFWLGFWNWRLGKWIWFSSFLILVAICASTFISGGRYAAFATSIIFALGYILHQNPASRKRLSLHLLWCIPLSIYVVGIIGLIRLDIGRGDMDLISDRERIHVFFNAVSEGNKKLIDEPQYFRRVLDETAETIAKAGTLKRVVLYSPHKVAFRGTSGLFSEFKSIFQVAALPRGFELESLRQIRKAKTEKQLGNAMANSYGFQVNASNSVEWSILSEAYARGGMIAVPIFLTLGIFWFFMVEWVVRRLFFNPTLIAIIFTVMVKIIFTMAISKPLFPSIKQTLMYVGFAGLILYLLYFIFQRFSRNKENGIST